MLNPELPPVLPLEQVVDKVLTVGIRKRAFMNSGIEKCSISTSLFNMTIDFKYFASLCTLSLVVLLFLIIIPN